MEKLEHTREVIKNALADGICCIFVSFGVDSMLVLNLVHEIDADVPVIVFNRDFPKDVWKQIEQIMMEKNLVVYAFPPSNRYFLPNDFGISLVDEYGFGGETIPVIRDIEDAETGCVAELDKRRFDNFDFGFNTVFTGHLSSDSHFAIGNPMSEIKQQGKIKFVSPLWDWSKEEIRAEVERLKLPVVAETGEIKQCAKCILESEKQEVFCHLANEMIPTVKWSREAMISAFRQKFGYEV